MGRSRSRSDGSGGRSRISPRLLTVGHSNGHRNGHGPDEENGYVACAADDPPGVEKVYRKLDVIRLTAAEVRELYLDWARNRVLHGTNEAENEFAWHILSELGGERRTRKGRPVL